MIGLTPARARRLVELDQAEHVGEVGQRQRRHAVGDGRARPRRRCARCRRRSSTRCAGAGGRRSGADIGGVVEVLEFYSVPSCPIPPPMPAAIAIRASASTRPRCAARTSPALRAARGRRASAVAPHPDRARRRPAAGPRAARRRKPQPSNRSRRRPPSTCRVFRCRTGRATPTVARAPAAPSARTPARFPTDGNYRTGWQDGLALCRQEVSASRRAALPAMKPAQSHRVVAARPFASRADLGRSGSAQALPAARLDGRRGVVPVPGRCARARLVRDRARPARLRPERLAAAGLLVSPTTSPISRRCSTRFAPGRSGRRSSATASAATSCCTTPACGRSACARVVSLDGFGIPAEDAGAGARRSSRAWLDALREPPALRALREPRGRRRPAAEEQPAAAARPGAVSRAALGRGAAGRHARGCASDPRHKLPFPTVYRLEEVYAIWRAIAAPVLWVAAADSNIPTVARRAAGGRRRRPNRSPACAGASRTSPNGRLRDVADAGHMLHHDQPAAVARGDRVVPCRRTLNPGGAGVPTMRGNGRGAYAALIAVTLIWGSNWTVMKLALAIADPVVFNIHRTLLAMRRAVRACCSSRRGPLLAAVVARGRRHRASSRRRSTSSRRRWRSSRAAPGARRCWCSRCRSGRCCSRGRCWASGRRGGQWSAIALAFGGPDADRRAVALARRRSRRSSGRCCRASAGRRRPSPPRSSSATRRLDMLNFIAWQMLVGRAAVHCHRRCCTDAPPVAVDAVLPGCWSAMPASSRSRSRGSCCGSRSCAACRPARRSLSMLAIPGDRARDLDASSSAKRRRQRVAGNRADRRRARAARHPRPAGAPGGRIDRHRIAAVTRAAAARRRCPRLHRRPAGSRTVECAFVRGRASIAEPADATGSAMTQASEPDLSRLRIDRALAPVAAPSPPPLGVGRGGRAAGGGRRWLVLRAAARACR